MNIAGLGLAGGPTLVVIILCSVMVVTFALERFFFLRSLEQRIPALLAALKQQRPTGGDPATFLATWPEVLRLPAEVLLARRPKESLENWRGRLHRALQETTLELKRFLWVMATVGAMAPFLGLLGTVLGIMRSFNAIGASGKSGFNVIASGLAQALATTAAGILVAIVAVVLFNYFQTRIAGMRVRLTNKLDDILDEFAE